MLQRPAGALTIYKNKADFLKRAPPLKSSYSLNGLGQTEADALIVLVPSSIQTLEIIQVPFFAEWISFGHAIPFTSSLNKLYIRECYQTIASSINKPGIRKR
jgi:hypothetical protein